MAKGKPDPNWKQKVLAWKASGMSGPAWCKENNTPYTTFIGWKQRFENANKNQAAIPPTRFIELKDPPSSVSGITLEYQGLKICLEIGFNPTVLKQCLTCIGGIAC